MRCFILSCLEAVAEEVAQGGGKGGTGTDEDETVGRVNRQKILLKLQIAKTS